VVLVAVGITTFFWLSERTTVFDASPTGEDGLAQRLSLLERDTDGDGLKDWEEELVGTDPRDPNSKIEGFREGFNVDENGNRYDGASGETNTTESFAQQFFGGFLGMSQDDGSEDQKNQLITNLVGGVVTEQRDFYTVNDLSITAGGDEKGLRLYGNEVVEYLTRYPGLDVEKALISFLTILQTAGAASPKELEHQAELYKKIANEFSLLNVPQGLSSSHLDLVNAYHGTGMALSDMSLVTKDSLRALTGFASYQENVDTIQVILSEIAQIFEEKNIIFEAGEPGYVWQTT